MRALEIVKLDPSGRLVVAKIRWTMACPVARRGPEPAPQQTPSACVLILRGVGYRAERSPEWLMTWRQRSKASIVSDTPGEVRERHKARQEDGESFDNLGLGNEIDKTIPLAGLRIEFRNLTSSRRGHF
jgi:hypothetical protein